MICEKCGENLNIGDYPFCPHGRPFRPVPLPFDNSPSDEQIRKTAAICADVDVVDGKCVHCGHEMQIGDYPFCPHGSIFPEFAQHFDPIVVHYSPATGEYRWAGSTESVPPAGFEKREIRTLREADRIVREENVRQDGKLESVFNASEASRMEKRKRRREFMDNIKSRLSPSVRKYLDEYREYQAQKDKERRDSRPRSANFHMEVFSMDSSNREAYADRRTDWKSRRS